MQQLTSGGHHQNPVMPGVCNGQSFAAVVHGNFPRKRQDTGRQGVSQQLDLDAVLLQQSQLPVVAEGDVGEECQLVAVAFANQGKEEVAPGAQ